MLLGHYGVALAAKRVAPRTSLGTLAFSAQLLDELWPVLLLLGLERVRIVPGLMATNPLDFVSYPISHSLALALLWSAVVGVVYLARRRYARGAWTVAALVASHWFLDVVMHRPDLPLWPGHSPKLGFGLWNSLAATLVVELALFGAGIATYLRATRARDAVGRWGLWAFVAFLLAIFLGGISGAPPPNERAIAIVTLGLWLFVPWTAWIDRHRELVDATDARQASSAAVG